MNLPVNESEPQTRQKIHFHETYIYVCRAKLKMHNGKSATYDEHRIVLIEESGAKIRSECYRKIWRHLNLNDNLRRKLTGSANKINLSQVIDMAGYGVITASPPSSGHFVFLEYHPRIDGKIHAVGTRLGQCGLGLVIQLTMDDSNDQKAP